MWGRSSHQILSRPVLGALYGKETCPYGDFSVMMFLCRVVMCCMRLGDCQLAREAIELLNQLANINGISALCQVSLKMLLLLP